MLQTRTGKRTAQAALKVAVDMVGEGLIGREDAVRRIDPASLDQLLHPTLDPKATRKVIARGLPASPGAAAGRAVFSADEAEDRAAKGEKVILVRVETPTDARMAQRFGAEGIGLCRTEHMFFDGDRIIAMREMIMAESGEGRRTALAKILPMQRADFVELFDIMRGLPVTIRLLDPP